MNISSGEKMKKLLVISMFLMTSLSFAGNKTPNDVFETLKKAISSNDVELYVQQWSNDHFESLEDAQDDLNFMAKPLKKHNNDWKLGTLKSNRGDGVLTFNYIVDGVETNSPLADITFKCGIYNRSQPEISTECVLIDID